MMLSVAVVVAVADAAGAALVFIAGLPVSVVSVVSDAMARPHYGPRWAVRRRVVKIHVTRVGTLLSHPCLTVCGGASSGRRHLAEQYLLKRLRWWNSPTWVWPLLIGSDRAPARQRPSLLEGRGVRQRSVGLC